MPDELIASRYRILRELGQGGMGVVYLAEHLRTGDHVALKLLHGQSARSADAIERFKREARAPAHIKSEHIVKVIDADVAPERGNALFLVMELLNGQDLEKQVETTGKMPVDQVIAYLGQAARALDKSHAAGVVHRDLKPENLFVHHREDGSTVLKVLDFGISKLTAAGDNGELANPRLTKTGVIMGTPLYMSPEQASGRVSEIGPPTDVWAIGMIAMRLLSGEAYWQAETMPALMAQIVSASLYVPSKRWSWMPRAVDAWFMRSCALDPKARFATVGTQIHALADALGVRAALSAQPSRGVESTVDWQPPASAPLTPIESAPTVPAVVQTERADLGYRGEPTSARTVPMVPLSHVAEPWSGHVPRTMREAPAGVAPALAGRRARLPWILGGGALALAAGLAIFWIASESPSTSDVSPAASAASDPRSSTPRPAVDPMPAENNRGGGGSYKACLTACGTRGESAADVAMVRACTTECSGQGGTCVASCRLRHGGTTRDRCALDCGKQYPR